MTSAAAPAGDRFQKNLNDLSFTNRSERFERENNARRNNSARLSLLRPNGLVIANAKKRVNILSDQKALTPEDYLLLDYQLCFPLYAASRLMTKLYQRELEPLGLTYPQYIVLLILWENAPCSVSSIGNRAELASNTLTPLLKRLELMGLVERHRDEQDERVVRIFLTKKGKALRAKCVDIPKKLMARAQFPLDQGIALKKQLDSLIQQLHEAIDRDN